MTLVYGIVTFCICYRSSCSKLRHQPPPIVLCDEKSASVRLCSFVQQIAAFFGEFCISFGSPQENEPNIGRII